MADKAYEYMDWPRIEAVVYGEECFPREILGPHRVKRSTLLQCFFPDAKNVKVYLKEKDKYYPMTMEDEAGYFAALIPGKDTMEYSYVVEKEDGTEEVCEDPYRFTSMLSEKDEAAFCKGVSYEIFKKLGAHPMRRGGVKGVYFAIWAPNALAVSVVGDFNGWNGKMHPMHKSAGSGIFELFLPCAEPGDLYKYQLVLRGGARVLRTDPYAMEREPKPGNASVVPDARTFTWEDGNWQKTMREETEQKKPLAIYEVDLLCWGRREDGTYANYRELAEMIGDYAGEMGYTHIELNPVMEFEEDATKGYATSGYYAPTSRFGKPEDFKYFVNYLHKNRIGVILDWTAAHFPETEEGMQCLDGTCLYEYANPARNTHPFWGTKMFNYDSPMVRDFLIGNAFYWIECFHVDGLRLDDVDAMLYLDYGRSEGDWQPNIYGSNEHLEAIDFLKHLNSVVKKEYPHILLIAQEDGLWPALTGGVDETHMGFDYKWNNGWTGCFLDYLRQEEAQKSARHDELTTSMLYAYCEDYILTLNSRDISSVAALRESLPGDEEAKDGLLKAAYGYLMTHPGRKMIAAEAELSEEFTLYMKELLNLYKKLPALYELDEDAEGFEWIQNMEAEKQTLAFLRKTDKKEETLLVICNFSGNVYEKYQVGVPYAGKYKEIFNSDKVVYGGKGDVNPRMKSSKEKECNEREHSIQIKVAPHSVSIFAYREK